MNSLTCDLDIVNYSGKWGDAKRLASYKYGSTRDGYFWQQVRINFLALGGQYLNPTHKVPCVNESTPRATRVRGQ